MSKRFKRIVGLVPCILVFLLLAACTNTEYVNESLDFMYYETIELATDMETQLTPSTTQAPAVQEVVQTTVSTDAYYDEGIGGFWGCEIHHDIFHNLFSFQLIPSFVSDDAFLEWAIPLWQLEEQTDECLVNLLSFITYFGITREAFQSYINDNIRRYFQYGGDIIDVLFSGDTALVEQYFGVDNAMLIWQERMDRQERYWNKRVTIAQQRVNENTTEMSWYFHDVWTYTYLTDNSWGWHYTMWMRDLVAAGEYDRVNVVEFINYFELYREGLTPGMTAFEHWANEFNMNIFTHYNFDILLSGDWDLIRDYYCITNQAAHSAQVQARFDAYVAANRYTPDTSWMVTRPPTQLIINPATATVQRGGQHQFAATASGPGNTSQAVTWSIQGSTSSNTTITDAGLLRVAQDETAATLTVRAVSAADTNIYATAAVTVTAQPPQSGAPSTAGPSAPSGTTQRPPADSYEHDPQQQDDTAPGVATIPEPPPIPAPPSFINPFVDVHEWDWFFDYVMYVYQQGLMTGMDTTPMTFAPNAHMTRAMAVQLFYNMEGRPSVAGLPNPFTDVAQNAWYRDAVVWAANNGLVLGLGGGIFAPGNNITRAHLTLILSNYADFAGITIQLVREYQNFADDSDIRYYARESVERLFRAAIINGRPDGSFDPQGNATRAELATMMHNFR